MLPEYHPGDLVLVRPVARQRPQPGDDIIVTVDGELQSRAKLPFARSMLKRLDHYAQDGSGDAFVVSLAGDGTDSHVFGYIPQRAVRGVVVSAGSLFGR